MIGLCSKATGLEVEVISNPEQGEIIRTSEELTAVVTNNGVPVGKS